MEILAETTVKLMLVLWDYGKLVKTADVVVQARYPNNNIIKYMHLLEE